MQTSNSLSTANLLRPLAEKRLPYSIIFNSTKSTIEAVCDDIAAAKEVTANRSTFAQEALDREGVSPLIRTLNRVLLINSHNVS
jgi:hypothetical protein